MKSGFPQIISALNALNSLNLQYPHDCERRPVRRIGNTDSRFRAAGMDYLAAADINCHMVDRLSFSVENQIARLCFRKRDLRSAVRLCPGGMRQADAVFFINAQYETGTVRSFCQAGTAPYIRIPKKFFRLLAQIDSHIGHALSV